MPQLWMPGQQALGVGNEVRLKLLMFARVLESRNRRRIRRLSLGNSGTWASFV